MSEYWKSNPKKFCDFCKCWIADNKPSVEFHERGKRHKENVQNRITEVRKSSEKKAKAKAEFDSDIEALEKAALEAFKKDLQDNPALAEHYKAKAAAAKQAQALKEKKTKKKEEVEPTVEETAAEGVWYEALSPEGYPYYWNSITNAPVWEAPEKYISIAEQERLKSGDEAPSNTINNEDIPLPEEEEEGPPSPVEDDDPPDIELPTRTDPKTSRSIYGGWQTVSVTELPPAPEDVKIEDIPLPEPPKATRPPKQKFREKTVSSLNSKPGEIVSFKKRKIASGARNTRQRDSDDP